MNLVFRPYQASDRSRCLDLFRTNTPRFFHADEMHEFAGFLDTSASRYWVVLDKDVVVACGGYQLSNGGRTARLCWGMVQRDRHAQGIGAALWQARREAINRDTGATQVCLATSQHTAGFYRRCGFEVQFVRPDGLAPGLDEVEMRLDLRPRLG